MHSPFCHYVNLPNPTPNLASWRNLTEAPPIYKKPEPPPKPPKITRENCPVRHCEHCNGAISFTRCMSVRQYLARRYCSIGCGRIANRSKVTGEKIKRIYRLRASGFGHADIAKRLKLAKSTVGRALRGVGLYRDQALSLGLTPYTYNKRKREQKDEAL